MEKGLKPSYEMFSNTELLYTADDELYFLEINYRRPGDNCLMIHEYITGFNAETASIDL